MMKMIHSLSIPLSPCPAPSPARPAAHFAGCLQTLPDLSAKGFPLGTSPRAAFCGVTAHHLDTLRTARPDLVASASTVTAWRCGTGGPGSAKSAPVDNFYSTSVLPTAEKMGIVDKVCKCLNLLIIPQIRTKVIILCDSYNGCYVK